MRPLAQVAHRSSISAAALMLAQANIDRLSAAAAHINPLVLPELTEAPPQPYRELKVSARVDRPTFEKHAWPMIATQAVTDPTITGEAIGYIYSAGGGDRVLSVYFTSEEPEATA